MEKKDGMITYVTGFKLPNEKWKKMRDVREACIKAGIDIPEEVDNFFGWEEPNEKGVEVDIPHKEWKADMQGGIEIDVDKIPEDVKVIRFVNSW